MSTQLRNSYPGILRDNSRSYGGSQRLVGSRAMRRCGCGAVAALDLVRYLHLYHPGGASTFFTGVTDSAAIPLPLYEVCLARMQRFVPVIYLIGTNGLALAAGLNRYFRRYDLPFTARWGVPKAQLWQAMEDMLSRDLPVILSVGNHFPRFWRKDGAALHRPDSETAVAARVHAHFVTVTGIDSERLQISSWGRAYVLRRQEFMRYRDQTSLSLLCNMVLLQEKD